MGMNRLKKLQELFTGKWRNALVAGGVGLFVFASWSYFQMPAPRLVNLERPKLTLTFAEEKATPAAQRRAVRPGQEKPADDKGAVGANRQIRKTPEERREAAKKRREERLARRRQALENRGQQAESNGVEAVGPKPNRPGRKSPAGNAFNRNRAGAAGADPGLPGANGLPPDDLAPLEELEGELEQEAYPAEEDEDPGTMIE